MMKTKNNSNPKPIPSINVGDTVQFKSDPPFFDPFSGTPMEVLETRQMFCRDEFNSRWLNAYTVELPNGERVEYAENQLVKI